MPPVGFEPMTLAGERPQTHALDRATTGVVEQFSMFMLKVEVSLRFLRIWITFAQMFIFFCCSIIEVQIIIYK
jgi:hypothetical protein